MKQDDKSYNLLLEENERLRQRIVELESLKEEYQMMQKQLLVSERLSAVGQLATGVAHEFNNILAVIMANAQTLLFKQAKSTQELEDQLTAKLISIVEQCNKGKSIVSNMMEIAKPREPKKRMTNIADIIDQVLDLQESYLEMEHIEVIRDYQHTREISMDDVQIQQVFLNLSLNARHAMKPHGHGQLTIRTCDVGDYLEIKVTDTGIGMDEQTRKKIFTPFFTTKRGDLCGVEGTGLGLAIVFQIVKNHSGTIEVESNPNRGATFTIRLAVCPAKLAPAGMSAYKAWIAEAAATGGN